MKKPGLHLVIVFWGLSPYPTHTVVVCVVRETRERKIAALYRPVMKRENMLFFLLETNFVLKKRGGTKNLFKIYKLTKWLSIN